MFSLFSTLWTWFTTSNQRSWYAHALVSVFVCAFTIAVVDMLNGANLTHVDPKVVWRYTAMAALLFYVGKEMYEENKYRRQGKLDARSGTDQVTHRVDRAGDLVGPLAVYASSLLTYLL